MDQRVKLTVAYLGSGFRGWQRQADGRTVQGELEAALERVVSAPVAVVGAGRTDAGVHAAGQVAHADLTVAIPIANLGRALADTLPPDLRLRSARRVGDHFHARRSATGKVYAYRASWRRSGLPWVGLRRAVVQRPIDLGAMTDAARLLAGRHDMASFTVTDPTQGPTVRTLDQVELRVGADGLTLSFVGDGFLRYQVRRMVGALFEVGWGRRSVADLARLIDRPLAGAPVWTAPPEGLTLERVHYRPVAAAAGNRTRVRRSAGRERPLW